MDDESVEEDEEGCFLKLSCFFLDLFVIGGGGFAKSKRFKKTAEVQRLLHFTKDSLLDILSLI